MRIDGSGNDLQDLVDALWFGGGQHFCELTGGALKPNDFFRGLRMDTYIVFSIVGSDSGFGC